MSVESESRYVVHPDTSFLWLEDGSGIAIYNGYNGHTYFLNVIAHESLDRDALPELTFPFTRDNVKTWLNLSDAQTNKTFKNMLEKKVFWNFQVDD